MTKKVLDINGELVKSWIEVKRPPIEIRNKLDWGYTFNRNVIEIFEIRPKWNNEDEFQHLSFAKIRYIKSQKKWKLYWMRASGKWQSYEPFPEASNLEKLLSIIDEDTYGCFKG